jgi:hypothetical protein
VTGYVASFSITPALPAGLDFDTLTGEISGIPAETAVPTVHTVTAHNSGGSSSTTISVEVYAAAPSGLSYPNAPFTFTKDVAIQAQTPLVTGCVDSFGISPALPAGLSFSSSTGTISGTPTVKQAASDYVVTATNGSGSTDATISIEVEGPLVCDGAVVGGFCWWFGQNNESCDQVCADHGLYNDATLSFAGSGGSDANCGQVLTAVGASNPTPVSAVATLNGMSGLGCGSDYSGTATSYRLTSTTTASASSAGNGTSFRRACACNDQPPPGALSYTGSPFSYQQCVGISTLTPSVSGYVAYYSISPALPTGLSFDTSTGEISGTPTELSAATTYTVTAHNSGGTSETTISIEVYGAAPSGLSYAGSPFTFTQGTPIQPQTPTVTGCVSSYGIAPTQPAGLSFNTSTGELSGTPSAAQSATLYTVTATNAVGSDDVTISIEITEPVTCGGTLVGGHCWYFGANNQSCTQVCGGNGYNEATRTYAGSDGSDANCGSVLSALGAFNPTPVTAVSTLGGISGLGCGSDYTDTATSYRLTTTTTEGASSASNGGLYFRRACACDN